MLTGFRFLLSMLSAQGCAAIFEKLWFLSRPSTVVDLCFSQMPNMAMSEGYACVLGDGEVTYSCYSYHWTLMKASFRFLLSTLSAQGCATISKSNLMLFLSRPLTIVTSVSQTPDAAMSEGYASVSFCGWRSNLFLFLNLTCINSELGFVHGWRRRSWHARLCAQFCSKILDATAGPEISQAHDVLVAQGCAYHLEPKRCILMLGLLGTIVEAASRVEWLLLKPNVLISSC